MFKNAVTIFRVYGIEIRIDPSWLLIAALFVWNLSVQYFPQLLPGLSQVTYFSLGIIAMFGFFASLLLHELAHSVVAISYGLKIKGITLFIFGGVAGLDSEPKSARSEFWIAIAGPAMSFALAGLGYILAGLFTNIEGGELGVALFGYLSLANLVLAIFNMVPAFPMDGGRVLRAFLWYLKSDLEFATRIASRLGSVLGIAFMALGLVSVTTGGGFGGFWLILIGFFVFGSSRGTYESQRIERILAGHTVGQIMTRTPITVGSASPVNDLVNEIVLGQNKGFIPVVDGTHLRGFVDRQILHKIDRGNWGSLTVADIYTPLSTENSIAPNLPVQALIEQMQSGPQKKFLVTDGVHLLGVVSLTDVVSYISLKNEFGMTRQT